jgi:hypothetical protein
MEFQGVLRKMATQMAKPIEYYLVLGDYPIHMNQLLDQKLILQFVGYECLNCGSDAPIFRQGFCKSCFFEAPQAADWIIRPELSQAHLGIEDRDLAYEQKMQLQPHVVYLANSSDVKVGVTRLSQVPTRWIDQGAHEALPIVEVPNRYLAGIAEVALKDHVSDKTNWRTMLKNEVLDVDLKAWQDKLAPYLPDEVKPYLCTSAETHLEFPVLAYPEKPKSLNLTKTPSYEGVLKGIKGQYLIFEDQTVFNVRSNEGLVVALSLT